MVYQVKDEQGNLVREVLILQARFTPNYGYVCYLADLVKAANIMQEQAIQVQRDVATLIALGKSGIPKDQYKQHLINARLASPIPHQSIQEVSDQVYHNNKLKIHQQTPPSKEFVVSSMPRLRDYTDNYSDSRTTTTTVATTATTRPTTAQYEHGQRLSTKEHRQQQQ
jgi:hypothetical protein